MKGGTRVGGREGVWLVLEKLFSKTGSILGEARVPSVRRLPNVELRVEADPSHQTTMI